MTLSLFRPEVSDWTDPEALIKEARRLRRRRWLIGSFVGAFLILLSGLALDSTKHGGGNVKTSLGSSPSISIPKTPPVAPLPTEPPVKEPPVVAIDVIGTGKLWLVDGYGMFYSSNWGSTWRYTKPPSLGDPIADYTSVSFLNSQDGWLIADMAKGTAVDHTVNGGRSWTSVALPKIAPFGRDGDSLSFANPNDGFIAIQPATPSLLGPSVILSSADGGSTWSIVDQTAPVSRISFDSSSTGWGLNPKGTHLYKTNDGGKSWQRVSLPMDKGPSTRWESLTLPTFFANAGVLLAQPSSGNALLEITHNSGRTWKALATPFLAQPMEIPKSGAAICNTCVSLGKEPFSAVNASTFVFLRSGKLYRTTNGGTSWTTAKTRPASVSIGYLGIEGVLGPVQFSSPSSGWTITVAHIVLSTRDGGKHFSDVVPPCHSFPMQTCASMGLKASP